MDCSNPWLDRIRTTCRRLRVAPPSVGDDVHHVLPAMCRWPVTHHRKRTWRRATRLNPIMFIEPTDAACSSISAASADPAASTSPLRVHGTAPGAPTPSSTTSLDMLGLPLWLGDQFMLRWRHSAPPPPRSMNRHRADGHVPRTPPAAPGRRQPPAPPPAAHAAAARSLLPRGRLVRTGTDEPRGNRRQLIRARHRLDLNERDPYAAPRWSAVARWRGCRRLRRAQGHRRVGIVAERFGGEAQDTLDRELPVGARERGARPPPRSAPAAPLRRRVHQRQGRRRWSWPCWPAAWSVSGSTAAPRCKAVRRPRAAARWRTSATGAGVRIRWSKAESAAFAPSPSAITICLYGRRRRVARGEDAGHGGRAARVDLDLAASARASTVPSSHSVFGTQADLHEDAFELDAVRLRRSRGRL